MSAMQIDPAAAARRHRRTHRIDKAFRLLCAGCTYLGIVILFVLLGKIIYEGVGRLDWTFLSNLPSGRPSKAGLKAALFGSLWLISMTALFVVPVGVSAAIFLEEYGGRNRFATFLETNISNLAGVPSIVYGILGLAIFVRFFAMGPSLLAGR